MDTLENTIENPANPKRRAPLQTELPFWKRFRLDYLWAALLLTIIYLRYPLVLLMPMGGGANPVVIMFAHYVVGMVSVGIILCNLHWFKTRPSWSLIIPTAVVGAASLAHVFLGGDLIAFELAQNFAIAYIVFLNYRLFLTILPFYIALFWFLDLIHTWNAIFAIRDMYFPRAGLFDIIANLSASDFESALVGMPGNRNWQATFLLSTTPFGCYCFYRLVNWIASTRSYGRTLAHIIVQAIVLAPVLIVFHYCDSRASVLGLLFMAFVTIFVFAMRLLKNNLPRQRKLFWMMVCGVLLVGAVGYGVFHKQINYKFETTYNVTDVRVPMWTAASHMLFETQDEVERPEIYTPRGLRFLLGSGCRYFEDIYVTYRSPAYFCRPMPASRTDYPHNFSFYLANSLGLPACLCFLFAVLFPFFVMLRRYMRGEENNPVLYLALWLCGTIFFHTQLDLILDYWPMGGFFSLCLGLLWYNVFKRSEETERTTLLQSAYAVKCPVMAMRTIFVVGYALITWAFLGLIYSNLLNRFVAGSYLETRRLGEFAPIRAIWGKTPFSFTEFLTHFTEQSPVLGTYWILFVVLGAAAVAFILFGEGYALKLRRTPFPGTEAAESAGKKPYGLFVCRVTGIIAGIILVGWGLQTAAYEFERTMPAREGRQANEAYRYIVTPYRVLSVTVNALDQFYAQLPPAVKTLHLSSTKPAGMSDETWSKLRTALGLISEAQTTISESKKSYELPRYSQPPIPYASASRQLEPLYNNTERLRVMLARYPNLSGRDEDLARCCDAVIRNGSLLRRAQDIYISSMKCTSDYTNTLAVLTTAFRKTLTMQPDIEFAYMLIDAMIREQLPAEQIANTLDFIENVLHRYNYVELPSMQAAKTLRQGDMEATEKYLKRQTVVYPIGVKAWSDYYEFLTRVGKTDTLEAQRALKMIGYSLRLKGVSDADATQFAIMRQFGSDLTWKGPFRRDGSGQYTQSREAFLAIKNALLRQEYFGDGDSKWLNQAMPWPNYSNPALSDEEIDALPYPDFALRSGLKLPKDAAKPKKPVTPPKTDTKR